MKCDGDEKGRPLQAAPVKLSSLPILGTGTLPVEGVTLIAAGLDQSAVDALGEARVVDAD
jgi:hypothetical protein